MNTHVGITNTLCPKCLTSNYDDNWDGKCKCGYQIPIDFIIDYVSKWDYSDDLLINFKKYKGLKFSGAYKGKAPELLENLSHLRHLFISRYKGFKFEYLANFDELEIFKIENTEIVDLIGLELVKKLIQLEISECRNLLYIQSIKKLNIKVLKISECHNIRDFEMIGNLKNLRHLNIYGKSLERLSFLKDQKKLEFLNLNIKIEDKDPEPLFDLKRLKTLSFKSKSFGKAGLEKLGEMLPNCEIRTY